jgi:hypothetical protein
MAANEASNPTASDTEPISGITVNEDGELIIKPEDTDTTDASEETTETDPQ